METITISKKEYEALRLCAQKMRQIEQTIHEDLSRQDLMKLQEEQAHYGFLDNSQEDIYSEEDLVEQWNDTT